MKNSILDYLEKREALPTFNFEGKEYKIKKDYKITLFLQQEQQNITNKKREDINFNEVQAQFELIRKFFEMTISKEFVKDLDNHDISDEELMFLFQFVINRRSGMSEEDAAAEAMDKKKEQ
jgi:hypothetical protein